MNKGLFLIGTFLTFASAFAQQHGWPDWNRLNDNAGKMVQIHQQVVRDQQNRYNQIQQSQRNIHNQNAASLQQIINQPHNTHPTVPLLSTPIPAIPASPNFKKPTAAHTLDMLINPNKYKINLNNLPEQFKDLSDEEYARQFDAAVLYNLNAK